ncbi:MAG TPA: hypothetical protein VKX49_00550 [Bryobacteraceae bacterium]|nr:hypothetical protein [Bryobacteraceae bacterium]
MEALGLQTDQQYSGRVPLLLVLRIVLSLHVLAVLVQAVLAGQFLSGPEAPVVAHARTAWFILALSVAQIIAAAWFVRRGGPLWTLVASIFVLIAEALQTGTGYGRFLGVHIPLGVFVFGAVSWMMFWAFRKRAAGGNRPA